MINIGNDGHGTNSQYKCGFSFKNVTLKAMIQNNGEQEIQGKMFFSPLISHFAER